MRIRHTLDGQGGFVLGIVLVFLIVLSLAAFYGSTLSRLDLQVVRNEQTQKKAFYIAEGGLAEALSRLGMTALTNVTVNSSTFDASFTQTNYKPNQTYTNWAAYILTSGTGPSWDATNHRVTTPTTQLPTSRLAYSTSAWSDSGALKISWDLCTAIGTGCTSVGAIRTIGGKAVLKIVSTGISGSAQRTITQLVTQGSSLSTITLDQTACPGIDAQGNPSVTFPGGTHVNGTTNCTKSVKAGGSATITAKGTISVAGSACSGSTGSISPACSTNAGQLSDPLSSMPQPVFSSPNYTLGPLTLTPQNSSEATAKTCNYNGSHNNCGLQITGTTVLSAGIYYGGITVRSGGDLTMGGGVYIIAGGGFYVQSGGVINGDGVVIYNTKCPTSTQSSCGYDKISIASNGIGVLRAPSVGSTPYEAPPTGIAGVLFFQPSANTQQVYLHGGGTGIIDGLTYAPSAEVDMGGGPDLYHTQLLVGKITVSGNSAVQEPTVWVNIGLNGTGITSAAWGDF